MPSIIRNIGVRFRRPRRLRRPSLLLRQHRLRRSRERAAPSSISGRDCSLTTSSICWTSSFTTGSDSDTLTVDELDETFDDQIGGLFWFNGSFEGRFLLNAGESTTRYLHVDTDGSWTFTIWPFLTTVERWSGGEAHGVGPDVLHLRGRPGVVSFAHRGESNFIADFYGDDSSPEATINERADVDGTVDVPVAPAVVVIVADGEWWLRR